MDYLKKKAPHSYKYAEGELAEAAQIIRKRAKLHKEAWDATKGLKSSPASCGRCKEGKML